MGSDPLFLFLTEYCEERKGCRSRSTEPVTKKEWRIPLSSSPRHKPQRLARYTAYRVSNLKVNDYRKQFPFFLHPDNKNKTKRNKTTTPQRVAREFSCFQTWFRGSLTPGGAEEPTSSFPYVLSFPRKAVNHIGTYVLRSKLLTQPVYFLFTFLHHSLFEGTALF